ncbi:MAG: SGNH/GDSL hydrolase family protein [Tunicatimonas sp.]
MLVLEGYIRGARIESSLNTDVDPEVGRIRLANAQYIFYNEGMSIGEFNEYGYIGPAYPPSKPANTVRIALLGDSYTEGLYMAEERHFRSLLENALREKYQDKTIQILNFGRSGFDLSDMYAYEENFVSQFNPDLVLYLINPFDFLQRNTDPLVPYWYLENDSLKLNTKFKQGSDLKTYQLVKGALQKSALLQMLKNAYNLAKSDEAPVIVLDKLAPAREDKLAHLKQNYQMEDIAKEKVSQRIIRRLSKRSDVVIINRGKEPWPHALIQWSGVDSAQFIDMGPLFVRLRDNGHQTRYWKATNQTGHWNVKTQGYVSTFLSARLDTIIRKKQKFLTNRRETSFKSTATN